MSTNPEAFETLAHQLLYVKLNTQAMNEATNAIVSGKGKNMRVTITPLHHRIVKAMLLVGKLSKADVVVAQEYLSTMSTETALTYIEANAS